MTKKEKEITPRMKLRMAQALIGVMTHESDNAVIDEAYKLYKEMERKERENETD